MKMMEERDISKEKDCVRHFTWSPNASTLANQSLEVERVISIGDKDTTSEF
jgi:hypothetical protein